MSSPSVATGALWLRAVRVPPPPRTELRAAEVSVANSGSRLGERFQLGGRFRLGERFGERRRHRERFRLDERSARGDRPCPVGLTDRLVVGLFGGRGLGRFLV